MIRLLPPDGWTLRVSILRQSGVCRDRDFMVPISGGLRFNSFAMAHAAARAGLGIAIFPEFTCAEDIRRRRLVPVLDEWTGDVGGVWLLHATRQSLTARIKASWTSSLVGCPMVAHSRSIIEAHGGELARHKWARGGSRPPGQA